MKKLILIAALLCGTAQAATQLVPMPFPVASGGPCMVELTPGVTVNGNMLISITVEPVWQGGFGDDKYKDAVVVRLPQFSRTYLLGDPKPVLLLLQQQLVEKFKACSAR